MFITDISSVTDIMSEPPLINVSGLRTYMHSHYGQLVVVVVVVVVVVAAAAAAAAAAAVVVVVVVVVVILFRIAYQTEQVCPIL